MCIYFLNKSIFKHQYCVPVLKYSTFYLSRGTEGLKININVNNMLLIQFNAFNVIFTLSLSCSNLSVETSHIVRIVIVLIWVHSEQMWNISEKLTGTIIINNSSNLVVNLLEYSRVQPPSRHKTTKRTY